MRALINYFLRGLVVVAPIAFTTYVCVRIFQLVDSWLPFAVAPGVGFVLVIAAFVLVGFLASTKDLLNAFVGEQRRFDKPVLVTILPDAGGRAIGFVTQDALDHLGLH